MNNKKEIKIEKIISILKVESKKWNAPVLGLISLHKKDPFRILISTIISLRTKDEITIKTSKNLFKILKKPKDIYFISTKDIEEAIYPCGFYKRKSIQIKNICEKLSTDFDSKIPNDINELLKFKGIGRKTANLVLSEAYSIPTICVDTHVHRISNRLGFIKTKTPTETEFELKKRLDKKYWKEYNSLLVAFGQTICRPISPYCSKCPIKKYCKKTGITQHR